MKKQREPIEVTTRVNIKDNKNVLVVCSSSFSSIRQLHKAIIIHIMWIKVQRPNVPVRFGLCCPARMAFITLRTILWNFNLLESHGKINFLISSTRQ